MSVRWISALWRRAVEEGALDVTLSSRRPAAYAPPVVLPAPGSPAMLIVCPPWRYPTLAFAREVQARLRIPHTIVALPPIFLHPSGGREWWGYAIEDDAAGEEEKGTMEALHLHERDKNEVAASLAAVRRFLQALRRRRVPIAALLGSSQGGTLAAHVGARTPSLRTVAYQPAGIYRSLWPKRPPRSLEVAEVDAAHGDLKAWRGRLGRRRRNGGLLVLFGTRDAVAPPHLCSLLLPA